MVIYARYSSPHQDRRSIDGQLLVCREYLSRQTDWIEVGTYIDEGITGESLRLRPGIRALLADAKRDLFDVVLSEDIDRLSRRQRDMLDIYDRVTFQDIKIYTLADNEVDETISGVRGFMSAMFLRNLAAKIHRGQHLKIEAGKSTSRPSYGYKVVKHTDEHGEPIRGDREIDPPEAQVINRALTEYASGISPVESVRRLNDAGIPSPDGGLWTVDAIRGNARHGTGLINNTLYIGKRVWNRSRVLRNPDTDRRVKRLRPVEEWVVTEVPELRIITDKLWDAVKARQKKYSAQYAEFIAVTADGYKRAGYNRGGALNATHRPGSLFSGLLVCGHCGGKYRTRGKRRLVCRNHRDAHHCANGRSILREELETRVLRAFLGPLTEPKAVSEAMRAFVDETNRRHLEDQSSNNAARKKLKETEKSLYEITVAIEAGGYSRTLASRLRELETSRDTLEAQLSAEPEPEVRMPSAGSLRAKIENFGCGIEPLGRACRSRRCDPWCHPFYRGQT